MDEKEFKPIPAMRKVFFINNEVIRVIHINRSSNIVTFHNVNQDKRQTMLYTDFKKHRKRAYSVVNSARILNRSRIQFSNYIRSGLIPPPIGATLNGERGLRIHAYYSEDHLFEIREIMSTIHFGRPRKDGLVTAKNVPTEQELRSRIGDAIMLYTRTSDGRFIPVWQENTW